ncbi:MAG: EAL domain-containing protein [Pseudomonadota bacterium]
MIDRLICYSIHKLAHPQGLFAFGFQIFRYISTETLQMCDAPGMRLSLLSMRLMPLVRLVLAILALPFMQAGAVAASDFERDPPFRRYSTADGLIQTRTTGIIQDDKGYFWIASFAGINRFDGSTFKSYTVRDGLRQSVIYYLYLDEAGRVWAGDSQGGLTLIEDSEITLTVPPAAQAMGVVRGIQQVANQLFVATEPGGLHVLDLDDVASGLQAVAEAPERIQRLIARSPQELLLLSNNSLLSLDLQTNSVVSLFDGIASVQNCGDQLYLGDQSGRLGELASDGELRWQDRQYAAQVTLMTCDGESLAWLYVNGVGTVSYQNPALRYPVDWVFSALIDAEGFLWIPARNGLHRYLGERFTHYPLGLDGEEPEIYAIEAGRDGDYWLGSSVGLLYLDRSGSLSNVSDELGFVRAEVRDIKVSEDGDLLWLVHSQGPFIEVDVEQESYRSLLDDQVPVLMGMERDLKGRVWAGSYFGELHVYDPDSKALKRIKLPETGPIYSMDLATNGELWFGAGNQGLFRVDTNLESAQPELVVGADQLGQDIFTQVVARDQNGQTEVWLSSLENGLYRWRDDTLDQVLAPALLDGAVLTQVEPVGDGSVVIVTTSGAARFELDSGRLETYSSLDGFTAIEGKIHANYRDRDILWIGTTNGISAMDLSIPMGNIRRPNAFITRRSFAGELISESPASSSPFNSSASFQIEFDAVSSRRPGLLEFSYRLLGADDTWSAANTTRSVNYSKLPPAEYRFEVRARIRGQSWGMADSWVFTVPTPFWRTNWFTGLLVLFFALLVRFFIGIRLRAIQRLNQRLQAEVDDRTASIEAGKRELEQTNERLSSEIVERRRADERREDVEARFHQAYKNAPIGMGLVDNAGLVYDANPHLKNLFWPTSTKTDSAPLLDVVAPHDRERFRKFLDSAAEDSQAPPNMEFDCASHDGRVRKIDFLPSPVRSRDGELRYTMLLAEDVTERRALTDKLAYQARFDELTGLLNRRAFTEHLNTLEITPSDNEKPFLMFLDLDRFKVVNDTCGHAAGDELLKKISEVISAGVREGDLLARLGGDEFALILGNCDADTALARAERIRQSIQSVEFLWEAEVFRIGASIGLVPLDADTHDVSELQRLADAACYTAKEQGRNRVHLVHGMADEAHEHRGELRWVQRLTLAMENDEFELFGQRIQSLGDREPGKSCIEVLLRLRDQEDGKIIPPSAFMPAAERFGLNSQLDLWVVRNALEFLARCSRSVQADHSLGLNLCGASLSDPNFSAELLQLVSDADLPAGALTFEITETSVIRRLDEASAIVDELRNLGCYISLDDFGSGMSSLGYLKHLNVDSLKIDGEFVRDMVDDRADQLFVKFIVDTAHALDKRVVAEFVESEQILKLIEVMGCDYAQGFAVHEPEPLQNLFIAVDALGQRTPLAS